jgi:hypothetical protein
LSAQTWHSTLDDATEAAFENVGIHDDQWQTISGGWKAVTYNGRLPWETNSKYESIDEQQ